MRWPWKRSGSGDVLVVSWAAQTLSYVLARSRGAGSFEILKLGVERQGSDSIEDFVRRLQGLGLKGREAHVMLRPEQYQLLQIDSPAVQPEELRSAARYQIREMLESHVDDVTLDVMRVGDGQQKGAGSLFVVAATNVVVRGVLELCDAMNWTVSVIDIHETAQRNLQSALAKASGRVDRASAALVLLQGHQAVLTISANEELFYTRRLDVSAQFMVQKWDQAMQANDGPTQDYMQVEEYVPDYSVAGVTYGNDYTDTRTLNANSQNGGVGDGESAQRFLVEVQRSLDVWDRTWSSMPLDGVSVYAGDRTQELANWLYNHLGQMVTPMNVGALFSGFESGHVADHCLCFPLLGVLMRTENQKL